MTTPLSPTAPPKAIIAKMIKIHIPQIETLECRNSDSLDFYDVSVMQIADAVKAAFDAGRQYQREQGE